MPVHVAMTRAQVLSEIDTLRGRVERGGCIFGAIEFIPPDPPGVPTESYNVRAVSQDEMDGTVIVGEPDTPFDG
jgi:hypothetical protein